MVTAQYQEAGTTLMELMIVILFSAMLIAIATTAWTPITERAQASSVQTNLQRTFTLARTSAVHRRSIVTVCPLLADGTCTADWNLPVAVILDPDNLKEVRDDDQLIKLVSTHQNGHMVPSNSGVGPRRYFQFNPDGTARGTIGNLTWCPPSGSAERASHVRVNFGGRLLWSRDTDGDGIVEDARGRDVQCL